MKKIIFLTLAAFIALSGCTQLQKANNAANNNGVSIDDLLTVDDEGNTRFNQQAAASLVTGGVLADLSESEIQAIQYMIEEEKLAKDVYQFLAAKWGANVFSNITQSEATHESAVRNLAAKYNLDVSGLSSDPGEFTNTNLQNLYQELIAKGSTSLASALEVGAAIEEIDILDLQKYMSETDNTDLLLVFENLERGSRNHLRSFTRDMSMQGVDYESQYLDSDAYSEITGSDIERGGTNSRSQGGKGNQGQGRGNGNR